jgi:hypothetical protein
MPKITFGRIGSVKKDGALVGWIDNESTTWGTVRSSLHKWRLTLNDKRNANSTYHRTLAEAKDAARRTLT